MSPVFLSHIARQPGGRPRDKSSRSGLVEELVGKTGLLRDAADAEPEARFNLLLLLLNTSLLLPDISLSFAEPLPDVDAARGVEESFVRAESLA